MTRRIRLISFATLAAVVGIAACEEDDRRASGTTGLTSGPTSTSTSASTSGGGGMGNCQQVGPEIVSLTTDDSVNLEADLWTTGTPGGPAAVLLHMIPPNDRTNYSSTFITKLTEKGITVLNVDRRGAGNSDGNPVEAYTGPNGKFDAKAAYDFLVSHGCAIDPARVGYVGASNGSTTALDIAIFAAADASVEFPAALVFLTGGGYTEAQNSISANTATLDPLPIQFVFATSEAQWSNTFRTNPPPAWVFSEYTPGDHGTHMFTADPSSMDDVANFLETNL